MGFSFTALFATATAPDGPPAAELAGTWVPTRTSEWYNRNPGKHSWRGKAAHTKMTYGSDGKGTGWVGEFWVIVEAVKLAENQFSATAKVPATFWSASDGNLTLLSDGTLEARYPSNGIIEYWKREGTSSTTRASTSSKESVARNSSSGPSRQLTLIFRKAFNSPLIPYHWALEIGSDIYEVNGAMAVYGPKGVIAASSLAQVGPSAGTNRSQYEGYIVLRDKRTTKSAGEIEVFCQSWVKRHPFYKFEGPNCQTFAEDLFTFCCGENLPYAKVGDLKAGPEKDPNVVWM